MAEQKRFTFFKFILFLISLAIVGLFVYSMFQPLFKVTGNNNYLEHIKSYINSYPSLLSSTNTDMLFPLVLISSLLFLSGCGALFTGIGILVIFISGIRCLLGKGRIKVIWLLVAGSFHLAFISNLSSSFYASSNVELDLGGIFMVMGLALAIFIYALEDFLCGGNKSIRRLFGTLLRIAVSGGFVYISIFCFQNLYRVNGSTTEFGQYYISNYIFSYRIEEELPMKIYGLVTFGVFAFGLLVNIILPLLPLICGSISPAEKHRPKNRSKKYIVQCIIMAILIAGVYFGTIFTSKDHSSFAMGSGLIMMFMVLGGGLVLSIISAIIDPRNRNIESKTDYPLEQNSEVSKTADN